MRSLQRLAAFGLALAGLAVTSCSGPTDTELLFSQAWQAERAGSPEDALRAYGTLSRQYPDSPLASIASERVAALAGSSGASRPPRLEAKPPERGDVVCTRPGLWRRDARWCGIVRDASEPWYRVELTQLRLGTMWALGLSSSTCSGDRFLSYWSYGARLWVPRDCVELPAL
jgi:hypothetical protein